MWRSAEDCRAEVLTQNPGPDMTEIALITGAANRIGAAMARHLARHGTAVIVHHNQSTDDANELVRQITADGGQAAAVQTNLTDNTARANLIAEAAAIFGPLTVLINNASIFEPDSAETMNEDLWDAHFALHAKAPMFLARDFARQLPTDRKGNIINMIDERVLRDRPAYFSYNLSKSVLWTATRTLAQSLAPRIRVNAIGPGPVLPNSRQSQAEFDKSVDDLPLQTNAGPDEIAKGISFILDTPSMTGQMLALDGGEHLEWRGHGGLTPAQD